MCDKKPGTSPLLARYKSTVDCYYKGIPDTGKEIQGDSITLKRKGHNSKEDSESSVEKKNRLENDDGFSVSGGSSIGQSSDSSTNIIKESISKKCHDKMEEHKLIIINKGAAISSADKKTFLEAKDGQSRIVSQENGVDKNKISSAIVKKINEEPGNKRGKLIKTGDMAGSVDEKLFGGRIDKFGFSREISLDESSCAPVDHKTSSVMKISYNEREGKLEMVVEELSSISQKRGSVCPSDEEDELGSVSEEDSVINANIMTERLEKEAEKSTSARKKESALKQKEDYVSMTTAIENLLERASDTKKTCKTFICDVCRVSFSSTEIKRHRKMCPSVVVKKLTVPEVVSWLSFSPHKTKVMLERLKEKDIKFWSSRKVHDEGSSSLGQRCTKDSMHVSSSQAEMCSEEKEKEQENIDASDNKYVCGKCRTTFPDVSNLKLHLLNHLTEPEELKLSPETEVLDKPLANSNLCGPLENFPGSKLPLNATGLQLQTTSRGSQTKIFSPGLQRKIISSATTIPVISSNLKSHESSPETNKNLASRKVNSTMNSPGFSPLSILHKTLVKQTSDRQTIPSSHYLDTETTSRLQTNAVTQEDNVKHPAEVTKNNSWTTQEPVVYPIIKQEVDDNLGTCSQYVNLKPTWISNNLQTIDSSRYVDARSTSQVLDHDQQITNHFSHIPDLPTSTVRVTPDITIQGGSRHNSKALARDDHVSSGEGGMSKTTGTGSALFIGSPVSNKNSLIVSTSLFSHGKTNSSPLKSSLTIQNSAAALPSSSATANTLQALRDKFKNSNQVIVNQLSHKIAGPGQKSLSKISETSQQKPRRKSRTPSADFKCSICSTILRTADELRKHEVVHTLSSKLKAIVSRVKKAEDLVCEFCKMLFVTEEQLKIHIHYAHKPHDNPVSSSSHKSHDNPVSSLALKSHDNPVSRSPQEQAEEFFCGVCKQIFDTDNDLKTHMTTFHRIKIEDSEENEVFYCGLCNKSFQTASDLENHMPVHTADKFVCGICNQPFIQSKDLIEHMGSHAGTSAL